MSCPICKRATVVEWTPFCSRRCADVDLGRWLTGGYAIPAGDDTDEDGRPSAGDDPDPRPATGPARPPRPS